MLERRYVIDTTVIVAWLLKPNGLSGRIVRSLELELYTPYKAVDELWSHKSEWSRKNPNIDLHKFVDQLQYYLRIQYLKRDSPYLIEAEKMMKQIDPDDAEFVALALELDAPIWSYDPHFRQQNKARVIGSDYIVRNSPDIPALWEVVKKEYFELTQRKPKP